jgi:hypothetical protein
MVVDSADKMLWNNNHTDEISPNAALDGYVGQDLMQGSEWIV